MDSLRRRLEDQLRRRELESSELRENLRELGTKFVQLERAFEANLHSQRRQELELNRAKRESRELREFCDATVKARAEERARLTDAMIQRDHWRRAFLRKSIDDDNKSERNAVDRVKREYEDVLRTTWETAELRYRELIDSHNAAVKKADRIEETGTYRCREREYENRSLELANLVETLSRFDVNVSSVCHRVAEALKKLTERGSSFDESLKSVRRLTWDVQSGGESDLLLLRKQNEVLKEVVRNLKRKFQAQTQSSAVPEREGEQRKDPIRRVTLTSLQNFNNCEPSYIAKADVQSKNRVSFNPEKPECNPPESRNYTNESDFAKKEKLLCVESHVNGVLYEEYILKLSTDREIKMKYPAVACGSATQLKMLFVDDETEYEKASPDAMLILLKNIYASVSVKRTGVSCSTQTGRPKTCSNFAQTSVTGTNAFSRLHVGAAMLNSEKRAIEKSLCNLEQTVASLKSNALGQARNMIGKDSQFLGNDKFFECVGALSR